MKVAKWGNSLAVRLPRSYVEALGLSEGDEVEIPQEAIRKRVDDRERRRAEALARMDEIRWTLPPDYRFDREEAHGRAGFTPGAGLPDER